MTDPAGSIIIAEPAPAPLDDDKWKPPPQPQQQQLPPPQRRERVDMTAHNGLRGVAAVWVVVFHCGLHTLFWPDRNINLLAPTAMPLFFILSGFSLAATYGATPYPSPSTFRTRAFLQNRAARVLPTYYTCLLPCIGLWLLGQGPNCFSWTTFTAALAANLLPVASVLMPFVHAIDPMNAPSWFVQTIGMIWLAVPCLLPWAQQLSDRQLVAAIVACYYLQAALLCGLYWPLAGALGYRHAGQLAAFNPLSRLPVFAMGLLAGVLVLRHPRCPEGDEKRREQQDGRDEEEGTKGAGTGGGMPWPSHVLGLPLPFPSSSSRLLAAPQSSAAWSAAATHHALGLFLLTAGGAVWDALLRAARGPELYVNMWWTALVPFSQLVLVVGLTRCCGGGGGGGKAIFSSWLYRALATPFAQLLGKISLGVYLVHEPLIDWLAVLNTAWSSSSPPNYMQQIWACAGAGSGRRTGTCDPDCALLVYAGKFVPKTWGIVVVVPLALLLGELLYRWVEEPARRLRWRGRGGGG